MFEAKKHRNDRREQVPVEGAAWDDGCSFTTAHCCAVSSSESTQTVAGSCSPGAAWMFEYASVTSSICRRRL